ncbi:uncharacterized protein I303_103950 [Kwoniella dejecticola CBS 10117]|uniref:Uncharacterized protein n=1 Tax=Kwoniella dejecticola CBS 10117 TaxID=1296121 RepID=A0A1A6A865_9TREE|nr:uncharacterized protein I303_03967 [Kwoniella dejecticola CBS 10117]OBR86247.1 hypothetical protein I303_03967 [Kwoniella dejecticola CBS 10117]
MPSADSTVHSSSKSDGALSMMASWASSARARNSIICREDTESPDDPEEGHSSLCFSTDTQQSSGRRSTSSAGNGYSRPVPTIYYLAPFSKEQLSPYQPHLSFMLKRQGHGITSPASSHQVIECMKIIDAVQFTVADRKAGSSLPTGTGTTNPSYVPPKLYCFPSSDGFSLIPYHSNATNRSTMNQLKGDVEDTLTRHNKAGFRGHFGSKALTKLAFYEASTRRMVNLQVHQARTAAGLPEDAPDYAVEWRDAEFRDALAQVYPQIKEGRKMLNDGLSVEMVQLLEGD